MSLLQTCSAPSVAFCHRNIVFYTLLMQTSINQIIISVSRQKLRVRRAFTTCSHSFMPPHTIWNHPLLCLIHTHKNHKSHTGKRNKSAQPKKGGKDGNRGRNAGLTVSGRDRQEKADGKTYRL